MWQSEDIDAVFDQDAQRVCILQGPVAVAHSKRADEPAGEILGGIERGLIKRLLDDLYDGDESKVPVADYLGARPSPVSPSTLAEAKISYKVADGEDRSKIHTYDIDGILPRDGDWLDTLAAGPSGPKAHWLQALLSSVSVVQGSGYVDNVAAKVLAPRHHQRVQVTTDQDGTPLGVKVFGAVRRQPLAAA